MRAWMVGGSVLVACAVSRHPAEPRPADSPAVAERPAIEPFPAVSPFRLPHTFEPRRYRARLALDERQFTGHVEIDGELSDAVSLIWLHGVELEVTRAIAIRDGVEVPLEFSPPRPDQLIGLRSASPLAPGGWTLSVDYRGRIHDLGPPIHLQGRDQQLDAKAQGVFRRLEGPRTYVFTHAEPTFARWIFPCIDEPDRKVPWQLTLDVRNDHVAASNTPVVRERALDATYKRVEFSETLPLPSYLIAFAVGPFEVVDAGTRNGVPIRALMRHGHHAEGVAAVRTASRVLDALERYLQVPYPYPKLDLVAVPDFGWGGMENPGLVTFDEPLLEHADHLRIMIHELAHQWFGNLVTLRWWDDMWLNESFAYWMADVFYERLTTQTREMRATQRDMALFELQAPQGGRLRIDSTDHLTVESFAASEIARGKVVLRALEVELGEESFRTVLRGYLTRHAHGPVETSDLAAAFDAAPQPLGAALVGLLEHAPPTLDVSLTCDARRGTLRAKQLPWATPVCVAYGADGSRAETCAQVGTSPVAIPLPGVGCPTWVMPSAHGVGLYRTRWTRALIDPLLGRGWSRLTDDERRTLSLELKGGDRLIALARVVDVALPLLTYTDLDFLEEVVRHVPDDLRPDLERRIISSLGPKARAAEFTFGEAPLLGLVAWAKDPLLARRALAITQNPAGWPQQARVLRTMLTLAARTDSRVRARLLDDVLAKQPVADISVRLDALARVPDIVSEFTRDPSKLDQLKGWKRGRLLSWVCDAHGRDQLVALAQAHPRAGLEASIRNTERCIAERATFEPAFRAWLGPRSRPTKTRAPPRR